MPHDHPGQNALFAPTYNYAHKLQTDTFLWGLRCFFTGEEAFLGLHREVHGAELTGGARSAWHVGSYVFPRKVETGTCSYRLAGEELAEENQQFESWSCLWGVVQLVDNSVAPPAKLHRSTAHQYNRTITHTS